MAIVVKQKRLSAETDKTPMKTVERIGWDQYFASMVEIVKLRSTCLRHQFGAIVTLNNKIMGTGYNGSPRGLPHCIDVGCIRDRLGIPSGTRHEVCMAVHAEQNAVIQGLAAGSLEGATLYTNSFPCKICAKMMINAGIKRLVSSGTYTDEEGLELLKQAGVKTKFLELDKTIFEKI